MDRATRRIVEHRIAVITLARQAATKVVKAHLRARGLKLVHFTAAEIAKLAEDYLDQHGIELIAEARETIPRWIAEGVFGKRAQRAHNSLHSTPLCRQSAQSGAANGR